MNRRNARFLALAASSLLIVGVFAGREMASWRPKKLLPFSKGQRGDFVELSVSNHAIAQTTEGTNAATGAVFDIQSEKLRRFELRGDITVGAQNDFFWQENSEPFSLRIVDGQGRKKIFRYQYPISPVDNQNLRILPEQNRVVLLDSINIYQWNFKNQKLMLETQIEAFSGGGDIVGDSALSRDGRSFIHADKKRITTGDTSTGKTTTTTPISGVTFYESAVLSPYGRYAFYDRNTAPFRWEVVSTASGKRVWGFNIPPIVSPLWAVSDDETTIFIPDFKEWQVRDLKTGALLRRLPFVAGVSVAALSPDGATLYSVANGVLFRQRAR